MKQKILTIILLVIIGMVPVASYGHGGRLAADG